MAVCRISRDQNNEVQEVYADNKKPSILYRDVLEGFNDNSKQGKENALKVWARAHTVSFRTSFAYGEQIPRDVNGEPLAEVVLTNAEKSRFSRVNVQQNTQLTGQQLAEKLSKKMGIPFEFDSTLNKLGAIRNGRVFINPNGLADDTIFHEFSHPFVEAIRKDKPSLFKNLSSRAGNFTYNGRSLRDFVIESQPELDVNSTEFQAELITTAIGLEAALPGSVNENNPKLVTEWLAAIYRNIAEFINKILGDSTIAIKASDLNAYMTIKDLGTLMRIDNEIITDPLNKEYSASQTASATQYGSHSTIDYFTQQSQGIQVDETGDVSFYTNGSLDPVTNALRKYTRLTEYTYGQFINNDDTTNKFDPEKYLDRETEKVFRAAGAQLTDNIPYGDNVNPQSFAEVKAQIKQSFEKSRVLGKILHKMIEGYSKFQDINHFQAEIDTMAQQGAISDHELLWFDENRVLKLMEELGLNSAEYGNTDIAFRDNVAAELMMTNDVLGIGTSNDGLVEHSDGTVSFIDYKTGAKFLADENSQKKMLYNDGLSSPIYTSKLNKAKLELVVRLIMAKMNKPDLRVRDLKIAYLSRYHGNQIRNVDVQAYLDYIDNNMRITIEELQKLAKKDDSYKDKLAQKRKEYKAMKDAKVFDFFNYRGENKIFEQNEDLKTITDPAEKVEWLKKKTIAATRQSLIVNKEVDRKTLKGMKDKVLAVLNHFKASNISNVETANKRDITLFASRTMGLRDQSNAFLQSFSQLFETSQDALFRKQNELLGEQSEFKKADRALYKEYFQRTGRSQAMGAKTFSYAEANVKVPVKEQGIFDFMYTWKNVAGSNIRVGAVYTQDDVTNGTITQTQFDYYTVSKKILKEVYEGVRTKVAYVGKNGQAVTYGKEYIKNDGFAFKEFEDSFLPVIPFQNVEEIAERNILTGKLNPAKLIKEAWDDYQQGYDLAIQNEDKFNIGVPLKYMPSDFVNNDDHSYNVSAAVESFSKHMLHKMEMDDVYDLGEATIAVMGDTKDPNNVNRKGELRLQNSIFALQNHLDQHILGRRRMTGNYTKNEKTNKKIDLFIDNIGGFISKNAFWFAPLTATFNGLYGLFTNGKEGLIGSLSSRLFGDAHAITTSIMARATKESGIHQGKNLTQQSSIKRQLNEDWEGSYYQDKVNFMGKLFRLNNKSYAYQDASTLYGVHNRIFTGESAYIAQGLGEDLANETMVIAALMARKIEVKSIENGKEVIKYLKKDGSYTTDYRDSGLENMWDAYKLNPTTKEYEYTGPTRFKDKDGQDIKGLTTLETLAVKTYLERMYGAYSPEQKTWLERYALGRMLMKFRKFQIMNFKENFTLNSHQKYVGEYKLLYEADGVTPKLKDGQPVYDWKMEDMRSRILVFGSLMGSFLHIQGTKSWSELSIEEKKQAVRFAIQLCFYGFIIVGGVGLLVPPEDKDKLYVQRLNRLAEDMAMVSVTTLLKGTTTLDSYPEMLFKGAKATTTFVNSVVTDDIVKSGPYKGDYKGWNTLEDFIPVYHPFNQAKKFLAGE